MANSGDPARPNDGPAASERTTLAGPPLPAAEAPTLEPAAQVDLPATRVASTVGARDGPAVTGYEILGELGRGGMGVV
jgi:hypothetical protein